MERNKQSRATLSFDPAGARAVKVSHWLHTHDKRMFHDINTTTWKVQPISRKNVIFAFLF